MVPPALGKVRQLVLQRVLEELEHDGDDGREPPVSKDEGLAPVAERVSEDEDVELFENVVKRVFRFFPVVDPAVAAVILFRNRLSKVFIQVLEKLSEILH